MSNRLHEQFGDLPIPEPDSVRRSDAIRSATLIFDQRQSKRGFSFISVWSMRAVFSSIVIATLISVSFMLGRFYESEDFNANAVLSEFKAVYGQQLQAVVYKDGTYSPLLSKMVTWNEQPVLLHISGHGKDISVISFSGQKITIPVNGRSLTIETVVTSKDKVILIIDRKLISENENISIYDDYNIRAISL